MKRPATPKGYIIEITDAEGYKHYPREWANGDVEIFRSDTSSLFHGYLHIYPRKSDAVADLDRIWTLAENRAYDFTIPTRPTLPMTIAAVPYKTYLKGDKKS